jgi:hypothetical protein
MSARQVTCSSTTCKERSVSDGSGDSNNIASIYVARLVRRGVPRSSAEILDALAEAAVNGAGRPLTEAEILELGAAQAVQVLGDRLAAEGRAVRP